MGELQLTTEIDKNSGFCFGVISAITKAENTLESNNNLYCLGEIVHNDEEIKRLEQKGLTIITKTELKQLAIKQFYFVHMANLHRVMKLLIVITILSLTLHALLFLNFNRLLKNLIIIKRIFIFLANEIIQKLLPSMDR